MPRKIDWVETHKLIMGTIVIDKPTKLHRTQGSILISFGSGEQALLGARNSRHMHPHLSIDVTDGHRTNGNTVLVQPGTYPITVNHNFSFAATMDGIVTAPKAEAGRKAKVTVHLGEGAVAEALIRPIQIRGVGRTGSMTITANPQYLEAYQYCGKDNKMSDRVRLRPEVTNVVDISGRDNVLLIGSFGHGHNSARLLHLEGDTVALWCSAMKPRRKSDLGFELHARISLDEFLALPANEDWWSNTEIAGIIRSQYVRQAQEWLSQKIA